MGNGVYVFGGRNSEMDALNTAERYDPESNRWMQLPRMRKKRNGASAAVLDERIFVIGGETGSKFMEIFHPRSNQWSFVTQPNEAHTRAVLYSDNQSLFVFGGWNGQQWSTIVEVYDQKLDQWTIMPQRSNFPIDIWKHILLTH
ncbi:hypothetical protein Ciccas_009419 [Cichlidogyrus casuarinus]|uniref:Uncharacterized protein n=1 Tax=Cichlidogyrus casuarinus TaxID=1844966 RepID=A0ABD2PZW0_9PLAT